MVSIAGIKRWFYLVKEAVGYWIDDAAPRLGAALAYYTVFATGPLIFIVLGLIGIVVGKQAAHDEIQRLATEFMGADSAHMLEMLLPGAKWQNQSVIMAIVGLVTLLFAALGSLLELRSALNVIWGVKDPNSKWNIRKVVNHFVAPMMFIVLLGVLLLASIILTSVISLVGKYLPMWLWTGESVLQVVNFAATFLLSVILFAMMFKWLPDLRLKWRDVLGGAVLTAILFGIGKTLIGIYVGRLSFASAFGAAGGVFALLIWVYYSAQIFFFGAEYAKAYAHRYGSLAQSQSGAAQK